MKQGTKRKLDPKDKREKPSWNKRFKSREDKQKMHAAAQEVTTDGNEVETPTPSEA
jgi:hypothetical protein